MLDPAASDDVHRNYRQRETRRRTTANRGGHDDASNHKGESDHQPNIQVFQPSRNLHDEGRFWKPPLRHQKLTLTLNTRKFSIRMERGSAQPEPFHTPLLEKRADPAGRLTLPSRPGHIQGTRAQGPLPRLHV